MFDRLIGNYRQILRKCLSMITSILTIFVVFLSLGISGCGGGVTGAGGAGNPETNSGASGQLVIEKAAAIPVINGKSTLAGVYIHNNGDTTVNNINYRVMSEPGVKSLSLPGATPCRNLAAYSSCLLAFSTPELGQYQSGSSILIADYNGHTSQQLISYSYVNSNSDAGVRFSDGITLFGTNDYATVYAFVGKGQSYRDVGFTSTDQSVGINNGLTDGRADIAANEVLPLELKSSNTVTNNQVEIISFGGHADVNQKIGRALTGGEGMLGNPLQVTITPQPVANLISSTPSVLNATTNESTTLTLLNNGLQTASAISVTSLDTNNLQIINDGCSSTSLTVGGSCQFKVKLLNQTSNGSANINVSYNNSIGNISYSQIIYYYNNVKYPFITMIPASSSVSMSYYTKKTISYTIANTGQTSWNNMNINIRNPLSSTSASMNSSSSCVNGANLAVGASCIYVVNLAALSTTESGSLYLQANGTSAFDNGSYSFSSKAAVVSVSQGSSSIYVASTTPQNNTTVNQTTPIILSFNTPMLTPSLNTNNIRLIKVSDGSQISLTSQGTSNNGQTVSFTISSGSLDANTQYQIVINPSQIYNSNNVAMGTIPSQLIATFTTNSIAAPVVSSYLPANGTTVSPLTPITVTFSQTMDPATLTKSNLLFVDQDVHAIANYSVSYDSTTNTASITGATLSNNASYSLYLNESQIKNTSNVAISNAGLVPLTSFTTNSVTTPSLSSINPANNATGVSSQANLSLQFDSQMNPATLTSSNITVTNVASSTSITLGSPAYSNNNSAVSFSMSGLQAESIYKVTLNQANIQSANSVAMGAGSAYYYFQVATQAKGFLVGGGNAAYLSIPFSGESPSYEFSGGAGFYSNKFSGIAYASDGSLVMAGYSSVSTSTSKLALSTAPVIFRNPLTSTSAESSLYLAYAKTAAAMSSVVTSNLVCLSNGMCNAGTLNFGVGQTGGILHSDDNGKSWYQAAIDFSGLTGADLTSTYRLVNVNCVTLSSCVFFARRSAGSGKIGLIMSSTDGGQSWVLRSATTGTIGAAFCGNSGRCLMLNSTASVYYSTDNGLSWNLSTVTNNTVNKLIYAVNCDVNATYCIATSSYDTAAMYTSNGGKNWTVFTSGASDGIDLFQSGVALNASGQFVVAVSESSTSYGAIAVYNQDGSFAYKRTVAPLAAIKLGGATSNYGNSLSCNGDNCVAVWSAAASGGQYYVTYSTDGGNSWNSYKTNVTFNARTSPNNGAYTNIYAAWCNKSTGSNRSCMLGGTMYGYRTFVGDYIGNFNYGLFSSTSNVINGVSSSISGNYMLATLSVVSAGSKFLATSPASNGSYFTSSSTSYQSNIVAGDIFRGVDCINNSAVCVAVGESSSVGKVYRTTAYNAGNYVTNITGGTPAGFYAVSCGVGGADNTCLAVGASGTFAKSTDGGQNWVVNNSIGFSSTFTAYAIHCSYNTCIVAGTDSSGGGSGVAYRSTDGGASWSQITGYSGLFGKGLFNVKCANGYCIMASGDNTTLGTSTSGSLLWSRDNGASWFDLGVYVGNFPMPAIAVYY